MHERDLELSISDTLLLLFSIILHFLTNIDRDLLPVAETGQGDIEEETHREGSEDETVGETNEAYSCIETEDHGERMADQEESCKD